MGAVVTPVGLARKISYWLRTCGYKTTLRRYAPKPHEEIEIKVYRITGDDPWTQTGREFGVVSVTCDLRLWAIEYDDYYYDCDPTLRAAELRTVLGEGGFATVLKDAMNKVQGRERT